MVICVVREKQDLFVCVYPKKCCLLFFGGVVLCKKLNFMAILYFMVAKVIHALSTQHTKTFAWFNFCLSNFIFSVSILLSNYHFFMHLSQRRCCDEFARRFLGEKQEQIGAHWVKANIRGMQTTQTGTWKNLFSTSYQSCWETLVHIFLHFNSPWLLLHAFTLCMCWNRGNYFIFTIYSVIFLSLN